jgi:hypothetical protein
MTRDVKWQRATRCLGRNGHFQCLGLVISKAWPVPEGVCLQPLTSKGLVGRCTVRSAQPPSEPRADYEAEHRAGIGHKWPSGPASFPLPKPPEPVSGLQPARMVRGRVSRHRHALQPGFGAIMIARCRLPIASEEAGYGQERASLRGLDASGHR